MSYPPIDTELLIVAFDDHSGDTRYVLDRESGSMIFISDYALTTDEKEKIYEEIDADRERYVFIEPIPSTVAYDVMADFVDQLSPSDVKERLSRALDRDRPFRRFKDVLYDAPPLLEQWNFFHQQRMIEYAREWLRN
jgi:hypothetical protein